MNAIRKSRTGKSDAERNREGNRASTRSRTFDEIVAEAFARAEINLSKARSAGRRNTP